MKLQELFLTENDFQYIDDEDMITDILSSKDSGINCTSFKFRRDEKGTVVDGVRLRVNEFAGSRLPIRFGVFSSHVEISDCRMLETLEGFPISSGDFLLDSCHSLTSLTGVPIMVNGDFKVKNCNKIVNLKGCPAQVMHSFKLVTLDNLESLEGITDQVYELGIDECPALRTMRHCPEIKNSLSLTGLDRLNSLVGCPAKVESFTVYGCNALSDLKGCPRDITLAFSVLKSANSLVGIHDFIDSIGDVITIDDTIEEGGLGILLIKNLKKMHTYNSTQRFRGQTIAGTNTAKRRKALEIIKKYVGKEDAVFDCQAELIENGYDEFAKL